MRTSNQPGEILRGCPHRSRGLLVLNSVIGCFSTISAIQVQA